MFRTALIALAAGLAPMGLAAAQTGSTVELPPPGDTASDIAPAFVIVSRDGALNCNDVSIEPGDTVLEKCLLAFKNVPHVTMIHVRADRDATYGHVADILKALRTNGFNQIALVTEP